jgi:hypothetical protein
MAQQQNTDNAMVNGKEKKSSEPLFGPSIGPVSSGPAWTIGGEKKVVTDELTPEVVNSWIEKSKEVGFVSLYGLDTTIFSSLYLNFSGVHSFEHSLFQYPLSHLLYSSHLNPRLRCKRSLISSGHHYASPRCLLRQMIYPRPTQPINITTVSNSNMIVTLPNVEFMFMSISQKIILMPLQHQQPLY